MFEHWAEWAPHIIAFAAIYCWLISGIFLGFSDFIMRALGATTPEAGIRAMQSINILVFRSIFMVGLFTVAGFSIFFILGSMFIGVAASGLLIAAGILYLVSVMLVSVVGNIPLNNKLATLDPTTPTAHVFWRFYIIRWNRWNHIRTAGSALAAAMLTLASFQPA